MNQSFFGYENGAFTDAKKSKKGLLEMASGGTILFDEVGDLPMSTQVKLLRFLENGTFYKLGSTIETKIDVRVISATNKDIQQSIKNGEFREDLFFFRLNVINIKTPKLKDHPNDAVEMAEYYLKEYMFKLNKQGVMLSDSDREAIRSYSWPGNIRELKNVMERTALFGCMPKLESTNQCNDYANCDDDTCLSLKEVERNHIIVVYEKSGRNKTKAALVLGVSRLTLRKKLSEYGLDDED